MTLLMMHRGLRSRPGISNPANPTARFAAFTGLSVPSNNTYLTDAYTAAFQVFIPADSAVAAAGFSTTSYRTIYAWHGSGEMGADNTHQMTGLWNLAQQLGYSGTPSSTFPYLVMFPQIPLTHTGFDPSSPSGANYANRLTFAIMDALIPHIESIFNCDPTRRGYTGLSQGGFRCFDYLMDHWQQFAWALPCAASTSVLGLQISLPGRVVSPATAAGAAAMEVASIRTLPMRLYVGSSDPSVPASAYQPTIDAYAASSPAAANFAAVVVTTSAHDCWNAAYANLTTPGSTLRVFADAQHL